MCLFTPLAFAGYSFQPATDGGLRPSIGRVPGSAPRWFTRPKTVTHSSSPTCYRYTKPAKEQKGKGMEREERERLDFAPPCKHFCGRPCILWRNTSTAGLPAAEAVSKRCAITTPETSTDRVARVARMISYTVKRVVGTVSEPVRYYGSVAWSQPTVSITNNELLNSNIIEHLFQRQNIHVLTNKNADCENVSTY